MSKFQTEEDLVARLNMIDTTDRLAVLDAMPDIGTLNKFDSDLAESFLYDCAFVDNQEELVFNSHYVHYLYNDLTRNGNDNLIERVWEIQKFAFYMDYCFLNLVDSAYSQYKLLLKKLGEVEWPKETLAELKANIEESRIPKNEFLPELLYAGSKSEIQRVNEEAARQRALSGRDPDFRSYSVWCPKKRKT